MPYGRRVELTSGLFPTWTCAADIAAHIINSAQLRFPLKEVGARASQDHMNKHSTTCGTVADGAAGASMAVDSEMDKTRLVVRVVAAALMDCFARAPLALQQTFLA